MQRFDAVIIGAGVTGSAVARELSRRRGRFLVLERAMDVCEGTSKANSAIVHAGFDALPGTLKAKMNVRGNEMMDQLARELGFGFARVGAMVVCLDQADLPHLEELYQRGLTNGVQGLRLLTGDEARALEPNLSDSACGVLLAETSGIVDPFDLTLGLAESAALNGVEFRFDTAVTGLEKTPDGWTVHTDQGDFETRAVVNAAGVYADEIHNWVSDKKLTITARRGEYMLLDNTVGDHVHRTIFQLPGKLGKGVLVTPTIHGNLLVGPTAADTEDKEFTATTPEGLSDLRAKCGLAVKDVPLRQVITSFSGLRAHEAGDDFVLGETAPGFFDAAGIESPGLTSAPAIGEYLARLIADSLGLPENPDFDPLRAAVPHFKMMPPQDRQALVAQDPAFGSVVCRCCLVTEGEIVAALHSPLPARTLDGVKRRTGAQMGRCQGGFCSPRILEILSRETGMDLPQLRKNGRDSVIVYDQTRK